VSIIRTMTGDISASSLGVTLCHEHLLTGPPAWAVDADADLLLDDSDRAVTELSTYASVGGGALVEMTTTDYGRDAAALLGIAKRSTVHVIAATGYQKGTYYPDGLGETPVEQLAARMVADIAVGMDGTEARAGVIKFGTCRTDRIRDDEGTVLAAVAAAQIATGVPISTHTQAGTLGDVQLARFLEAGVSADSVLIGHVDRNLDYGYLRAIAEGGAWLGFDHWTKSKYAADDDRVSHLLRLLEDGHDRIMVSGDLGRPSYQLAHGGTPGFSGIVETIRTRLGAEVAEQLLVRNPARFFAFEPSAVAA
jgi:predicted metal-dependent phosphotriesterase family hydrolase